MTQTELATVRGFHQARQSDSQGRSADHYRVGLERVTGVPTHVWNNLETYTTRLAEQERLANDAEWLEQLPVSELVKRGKIESRKGSAERVRNLCGVANQNVATTRCGVPSIAGIRRDPGAVAAWLRIGEIEATKTNCAPFDKSTLLNR